MDDIAIKIDNVNKSFKLPHEKQGSIKSILINSFRGSKTYEKQQVLKNISFEIKKGEFFGIVGRNGSGKSTLLKLLAGVYSPNSGQIHINGKLTPFIELGVGFNPELTGRENVYLNGALLGFSRKEMDELYEEIVAFAELERFMDQKLKNYSSGMQVRLAFSIAIRAKSEILLLDEVLAVGDVIFQKKCYDYFKQLKKQKRTVVFVSHDTGALQEYCDNSILVNEGEIVYKGKIDTTVRKYLDLVNDAETETTKDTEVSKRWGTGKVLIEDIKILQAKNSNKIAPFRENEDIGIRVRIVAKEKTHSPVIGITIRDLAGQIVFQSNTLWLKVKVADRDIGEKLTINWSVPNAFNTGTYTISPGVSDSSGTEVLDWLEDAVEFKVSKKQKSHALINIEHKLSVSDE
ncbi:MAG: ABC transporter ATP-binding protein [Candidatus Saccharimonadales bacterium]